MLLDMCVQRLGCRSRNESDGACLQICGDMPEGEVSVLGCALEMCVHRAVHKCRAVSYSLGVCKLHSVFVIL